MKIGIVGSRNLNLTPQEIINELSDLKISKIISGGAKGIDTTAKNVAEILQIPCKEFLPNYSKYGKIAPLIRNEQIVNESDIIFAFWDGKSRGTKHSLNLAKKKNIPIQIFYI